MLSGLYQDDVVYLDGSGDVGCGSTTDRKKGKKSSKSTKERKPSEKEIMKEYAYEQANERCTGGFIQQRKMYENLKHLSNLERQRFEQKFCQPKNRSQQALWNHLKDQTKKIIIATGPAGTGKTLLATQMAIRMFLMGVCDKIIFTRPSVSVDEELGFLPGTLEEKMAPWMRPLYDILYGFMHPKELLQLIEEKVIEISPLGFMRGRTFKNCCIIADEMQNCTLSQMKMMLTRIGSNTRLFITGDLEQCDRAGSQNGLEDFLDKLRGRRSDSITSVEFNREDIEREEVVKEVLDIYSSERVDYYSDLSDSASASESS